MDEEPTVLPPVKARQGVLGRPVLIVLITSMILVVIGFAAAYWGTIPF
jgi:hypothetical protein